MEKTLSLEPKKLFLVLAIMAAVGRFANAEYQDVSPPNVLLIAVDDLRPELSTYGVDGIHTPHIDRLSEKGLKFDAAYCQYPVCNPSRCSFLTGKRPDELGILSNRIALRKNWPHIVTLPQHFRDNGYFTAGLELLLLQATECLRL